MARPLSDVRQSPTAKPAAGSKLVDIDDAAEGVDAMTLKEGGKNEGHHSGIGGISSETFSLLD